MSCVFISIGRIIIQDICSTQYHIIEIGTTVLNSIKKICKSHIFIRIWYPTL